MPCKYRILYDDGVIDQMKWIPNALIDYFSFRQDLQWDWNIPFVITKGLNDDNKSGKHFVFSHNKRVYSAYTMSKGYYCNSEGDYVYSCGVIITHITYMKQL